MIEIFYTLALQKAMLNDTILLPIYLWRYDKMTGILAVNAFLHGKKYTELDDLLLAGAKPGVCSCKSKPI